MVLLAIFNSSFSEVASHFSAKNGGSRSVWTIDLLHLLHDCAGHTRRRRAAARVACALVRRARGLRCAPSQGSVRGSARCEDCDRAAAEVRGSRVPVELAPAKGLLQAARARSHAARDREAGSNMSAVSGNCGCCWGTGYVDGEDEYGCWWGPCPDCKGSGNTPTNSTALAGQRVNAQSTSDPEREG